MSIVYTGGLFSFSKISLGVDFAFIARFAKVICTGSCAPDLYGTCSKTRPGGGDCLSPLSAKMRAKLFTVERNPFYSEVLNSLYSDLAYKL